MDRRKLGSAQKTKHDKPYSRAHHYWPDLPDWEICFGWYWAFLRRLSRHCDVTGDGPKNAKLQKSTRATCGHIWLCPRPFRHCYFYSRRGHHVGLGQGRCETVKAWREPLTGGLYIYTRKSRPGGARQLPIFSGQY